MAAYMFNSCLYKNCGMKFKYLSELIVHTEETHIDFDPQVMDKAAKDPLQCVPFSYINRFMYRVPVEATAASNDHPTSPELDLERTKDTLSEEEISNDSWTVSENSSDLNQETHKNNFTAPTEASDKPYSCDVIGCNKRYKNLNGFRYHLKHGHKKEIIKCKQFVCSCGKSYKSAHSLKNHKMLHHNGNFSITKTVLPKMNAKTKLIARELKQLIIKPTTSYIQKVAAIEDHGYMKTQDDGTFGSTRSPNQVDPFLSYSFAKNQHFC